MIYVMVDVLVVPFEEGGEIYYYEIDPRTGYPSRTGVNSATVTAPNCTDADALATALIIMGEKEGLQVVEAMDGVEAFLILREGRDQFRWVKSSGMKVRER
ncbi:MAG: FAD:protein FMN transferase [Candidatus Marinimicrobia bacterium]|nr:FAD:protein FMN transferase [Candidatus Neomarinimicrobiota bacterium]